MKKVAQPFSTLSPCPSLPSAAKNDRKQSLNLLFNNKTRPLLLEFNSCKDKFEFKYIANGVKFIILNSIDEKKIFSVLKVANDVNIAPLTCFKTCVLVYSFNLAWKTFSS